MSKPTSSALPQQKIAWSIVHELCISFSSFAVGGGDQEKWNSMSNFRRCLGESAIRPALEGLLTVAQYCSDDHLVKLKESIKGMTQMWKESNCFDSPTLMDEIARLVVRIENEDGSGSIVESKAQSNTGNSRIDPMGDNPADNDNAMEFETAADENDETLAQGDNADQKGSESACTPRAPTPTAVTDGEMSLEKSDVEMSDSGAGPDESSTPPPRAQGESDVKDDGTKKTDKTTSGTITATDESKREKAKEFDFESEGIPEGKVEVRELTDPCKAIATMQITRDLRNDSSYNLSTQLSKVPDSVFDACRKAKTNIGSSKVPIDDLPAIPDDILDLDVSGALANVKLHRQIIEKQKEHRLKCIELLVKSRCKFGSETAAELYYSLDEITKKLKKRKALILDAMALEGLDFEALGGEDGDDKEDKIDEFLWLSREDASKKLRTE